MGENVKIDTRVVNGDKRQKWVLPDGIPVNSDNVSIFFKRQNHKMVKHTQTIRRQFADELIERVSPFCGIGA